jgi:hypothetical protein
MSEGALLEERRAGPEGGDETLLERAREVYQASRAKAVDSGTRVEKPLAVVGQTARLYFGYHIPPWPPKMLARKLIRLLMMPLLNPQVKFNEAVRDVLLLLRQRDEARAAAHREAQLQIERLEHQVEVLTDQVDALSRLLAARGETSPTTWVAAKETNGVEAAPAK